MSVIVDAPQRQEALNVHQSFIVQAPAGSGKTELLTQRYLALLSTVHQPEEILAITFTRKAASEMRHRILHALQKAQANTPPTSAHGKQTDVLAQAALKRAREKNWHLLANPQRFNIYTIDALCAHLVAHLPILSRFGIRPAVTEDPVPHYEQAIAHLFTALENRQSWSDAIARLYRHLDNNEAALCALLKDMLAHREQWLPHTFHKQYEPLRTAIEAGLQRLWAFHLEKINTLTPTFPHALLKELMEASAHYLDRSWSSEESYWQYVSRTLLTTKNEWRKTVTKTQGFPSDKKERKQQMLDLIEALRENLAFREALLQFKQLPPPHYEDAHWIMVETLLTLLPVLTAQLQLVFQEAGEVDFQEMAQGALHALGSPEEPTDLALYYDHRIQHLLVDEFQDTSLSQYTFLKQLTAGWQREDDRTVFFVGDPMQSIYRFRQADVGLFLRVKAEGFGEKYCQFIALSTNFRSHSPLIDWFNKHFRSIFPAVEDREVGAIPYSPSIAHNKEADAASGVHWHFASSEQEEALYITRTIENLRRQDPHCTIAILVRARSHLRAIIDALTEKNLPYNAMGLLSLWDIRAVRDVVALFSALHHCGDTLSWLSVLRAPYVGLTLADLHVLTHTPGADTLWQAMTHPASHALLSPDGRDRLNRIVPVIKKSMTLQYQQPLDQWLKETWIALGGPHTLRSQTEEPVKAFFNLLQQYATHHEQRDPAALKRLCQRTSIAYTTHHPRPIHIMTIHKAKGLEFDGVFIPQLQRRTHYDSLPLLHWCERLNESGSDLLISSYKKHQEQWPLYQYIHELHKKKGHYEAQRLLYVACTRAKNALYLSGEIQYDDEGDIRPPPKHSFLHTLWDHALPQVTPPAVEPTSSIPDRTLYRLPHHWQSPTSIAAAAPRTPLAGSTPLRTVASRNETLLGIFYHELLQHIAENADYAPWIQQDHWKKRLQQLGVTEKSLPALVDTLHSTLPLVLKDPKAQWILTTTHASAACEYALQYFHRGKLTHIIVDRTFIDNGVRWIIDYKVTTGTPNPRMYYEQLQNYGQRWQEYEKMPVALGIYFPLQQHFEEMDV